MDIRKIIWEVMDSFGSGHGPVVGSCEHCSEPSAYIKGREFLANLSLSTIKFSWQTLPRGVQQLVS
jgi:hypothetical protein